MTVNTKLWTWFERGQAPQALCGQREFFIGNHTYRDRHDDGLVLDQLSDWAATNEKPDEASSAFTQALRDHLSAGRGSDVIGLVWSYMVLSQYREMTFAMDLPQVREILTAAGRESEASETLARFATRGVSLAFLLEQLAVSDGRHFEVPRWEPPARPSP